MADVGTLGLRRWFEVAALASWTLAAPAKAQQNYDFSVAAGPLGPALIALGRQAQLSIGLTDPTLAVRRSGGVRGRHSVKAALRIALRGTGASFTFVDVRTVFVFAPPRRPAAPPGRLPVQPQAGSLRDDQDIIVTASKDATTLSRYPATTTVLDLNSEAGDRQAAQATAALVARMPILAATELGPGRNKLFIRGVADSSFNGSSQATVGQYLGDARLTYNAPDPDLNLYDIARVEVLEGPQGTLYGTGSIGGIIRLVPNPPDPRAIGASFASGLTTTKHGASGGDAAAMINLPLVGDTIALRGVGYATVEGGYIDDPARRLTSINRNVTTGGRLALRWAPGGAWTIDGGVAVQNITSDDGQYTLRGSPGLTRASRIAQPFDNDYRMGFLTVTRAGAGTALTSTTAAVRHDIDTAFDATGYDGSSRTARFDEKIGITFFSHETRLSGGGSRHPWLAGLAGTYDISRVTRALGDPLAPSPISGVRNETGEVALFGQYGVPLTDRLQLTVGARATFTHGVGTLIDDPNGESVEVHRNSLRFSPSAALAWRPRDKLLIFAHLGHGTRAGGLAVSPSGSAIDAQRFEADVLTAGEIGLRAGRRGTDRFWAVATMSYAWWKDIQADLIDRTGFPYTTNVGDGRIVGFEAQGGWRPLDGVEVEGGLFVNSSALTDPAPAFVGAKERELPNIAETGARVGATYKVDFSPHVRLTLDGALRYVGRSQLGGGTPFELPQGDYLTARAGLRLAVGRFGMSLDVDNIADVRGNRFAYGNPFGAADGNQITPLRPRNIRLGIDRKF